MKEVKTEGEGKRHQNAGDLIGHWPVRTSSTVANTVQDLWEVMKKQRNKSKGNSMTEL
jgi:hypothetical protein